jgi:hypothetical protein
VTDQAAIKNWIKNIDNTKSLNLAIANAGASTNTPGKLKNNTTTQYYGYYYV